MRIYTLQVGEIGTNCYLAASDAGNAAIVDPGAEPERIAAALTQYSLTPALILLTHGHFDHIGAAEALRQWYHIPLYVHAADAELLSDPAKNGGKGLMGREVTAGCDHLLVDGDRIPLDELEFQVIHTPGHTKGSVCFAADGLLLTGLEYADIMNGMSTAAVSRRSGALFPGWLRWKGTGASSPGTALPPPSTRNGLKIPTWGNAYDDPSVLRQPL